MSKKTAIVIALVALVGPAGQTQIPREAQILKTPVSYYCDADKSL